MTSIAPPLPYRLREKQVVARLADLLELRERAAKRGYVELHREYTERIVDELVGDAFGLNGPGGHAA